jgi:hypothetical protein
MTAIFTSSKDEPSAKRTKPAVDRIIDERGKTAMSGSTTLLSANCTVGSEAADAFRTRVGEQLDQRKPDELMGIALRRHHDEFPLTQLDPLIFSDDAGVDHLPQIVRRESAAGQSFCDSGPSDVHRHNRERNASGRTRRPGAGLFRPRVPEAG